MGYFTPADLPFTNSLASTYPIGDRYFCSVLAQTYPNRRYLMAATSLGQVGDTYTTALPPNGTIFDSLDRHGISWKNYYSNLPSSWSFIGLRLAALEQGGSRPHLGLLRGLCVGEPACVLPRRPRLQHVLRGEPPGRPVRRRVPLQGGGRGDGRPQVAQDVAHLELRRARRLLRPRAASRSGGPRRRRADAVDRAGARGVRSLGVPGACRRGESPIRVRTTSPTPSTTTPRCSAPSRSSGTCRRSPVATRRRTTCSTWSTSTRRRPSSIHLDFTRPRTRHRRRRARFRGPEPSHHRARWSRPVDLLSKPV